MNNFFSQNGEDAALSAIFRKSTGVCVEVGAHDGVALSNTYHFERRGWRCILVEPNPAMCRAVRQNRNWLSTLFECAASDVAGSAELKAGIGDRDLYSTLGPLGRNAPPDLFQTLAVATRTLDSILEEAGVRNPDFISIDVEGHELQVLRGFTLSRWRPRLVLVEDNSDLTDSSVAEHFKRSGYFRFYRSGANDWYARPGEARLRLLFNILRSGRFSWKGLLKASGPAGLLQKLLLLRRSLVATGGARHPAADPR
jgi:FkbM family methyltransferase